jgi:hypothetical protein
MLKMRNGHLLITSNGHLATTCGCSIPVGNYLFTYEIYRDYDNGFVMSGSFSDWVSGGVYNHFDPNNTTVSAGFGLTSTSPCVVDTAVHQESGGRVGVAVYGQTEITGGIQIGTVIAFDVSGNGKHGTVTITRLS